MIAYYAATLGISLTLSLVYVFVWHKHFDVHFTLLFTFIPISNLGFLYQALSTNLREAIMANHMVYLGGCFQLLFIMMCILDRCNIEFPRGLRVGLFVSTLLVYGSELTAGSSGIFYTELALERTEEGSILVKEYGFMHTVLYVMLAVYFAISIWALVYSYVKKKDVSNKIIFLMAIPEAVSIFSYFGTKLFPSSINPLPATYCFAEIFYLIIVNTICLYDVSETHIDSLIESGESGFLSFDFKYRYLGANAAARKFFPELNEVKVDTPAADIPFLEREAVSRLKCFEENEENDTSFYSRDGHTYLFDVDYLYDGQKRRGYRIFISDDTKNQQYIALLNSFNNNLQEEVDEKTEHIKEMHDKLILSMATLVESRDNSTGGHIKRTSECVRFLMDEIMKNNRLHVTNDFRKAIIKAAPMHDLGKIAVDDAILRKPGRFEPWEFEKMKMHAAEGGRIVHQILEGTDDEYFRKIAENVANYHHERWDGSGYPEGLKGLEIPLEARIMAIADVYDALVSKRVYKESMSFEEADRIIMEGMGKHFDKRLEPYYVAARPKLEAYYRKQNEEAKKMAKPASTEG